MPACVGLIMLVTLAVVFFNDKSEESLKNVQNQPRPFLSLRFNPTCQQKPYPSGDRVPLNEIA